MELVEEPREELDGVFLLANVEALLARDRDFLDNLMRTDLASGITTVLFSKERGISTVFLMLWGLHILRIISPKRTTRFDLVLATAAM